MAASARMIESGRRSSSAAPASASASRRVLQLRLHAHQAAAIDCKRCKPDNNGEHHRNIGQHGPTAIVARGLSHAHVLPQCDAAAYFGRGVT